MFAFYKNGERIVRYAHQLVLTAFVGPCPTGKECRHLDGDHGNAALRNADGNYRLVWGSSSENKFDEVRHGTHYEASRTHCENGHEWTKGNTRIETYPDDTFRARRCRECARLKSALVREARRADVHRRCKEEGCDEPYFGKEWCSMHYARWRRSQPGIREREAANQRAYLARKKSVTD